MIDPSDAARRMVAAVAPLPAERVPLPGALDRVLAVDISSPLDLPAWDNSAMDGYAVRSEDVGAGDLTIIESIAAGAFPTRPIGPGECARIFTGAPLPEGADGVIRQEDTTALDGGRVRINDPRDAGRNIRHRGEDIRAGSVVLARGAVLGPARLGVLASIAEAAVAVHRRPVVAFLGSGDEIATLEEREAILAGRKIASSNSYTVLGNLLRMGAVPLDLGIARDDPADLAARLERAREADLIVTTAGISVGEHDHLRAVIERLGGTIDFWRLRMRPGAPVGFGAVGGVPWIGLPGNPVSAMVTFELFVRPVIRRLQGHALPFRRAVPVRAGAAFTVKPRLVHFQRAIVEDGVARLTGPQGSGILTSMALANALLVVPAEIDEVVAGMDLRAILLDDPVHVAEPEWP